MMSSIRPWLRIDGRVIHTTLHTDTTSSGAGILFLHGYGNNQTSFQVAARMLTETYGHSCLTIDLGGHGKSSGNRQRLTARQHISEVQTALSALALLPCVSGKRVGIVGTSYGAHAAIMAAGGPPETLPASYTHAAVQKVLAHVPAVYPDGHENLPRQQYDREAICRWRQQLSAHEPNRNLAAAARLGSALTLVQSGRDTIIPPEVLTAYAGVAPEAAVWNIPHAGHKLDPPSTTIFNTMLLEWAADL